MVRFGAALRRYGFGELVDTMTIGDISIENVTSVSESGGMDAPERKTEKGFSYTTLVDAAPISAKIQAVVTPHKYKELAELRDAGEPFQARIGVVSLGKCKLDNLSVDQEASKISHYAVTISVTEVKQATTGTATLSIDAEDGGSGTQSSSSDVENPTLVRTQDEEGGGDGGDGGMDPLGDLADWTGF